MFSRPATTPSGDTTGTNFFSQFNPFASNNTKTPVVTPPVNVTGNEPGTNPETQAKLLKVSSMGVAGFTVFSKERIKEITAPPAGTPPPKGGGLKTIKPLTEFIPNLRYVDRATGNIFETFADKIQEQKFSSTTIPQIYEAFFGNNGESVLMRFLKSDNRTIETFVGILPKEYLGANINTINQIKGSFLPENIKDVSLSPGASSIFYLFTSGDSMVGTTMNLATNQKNQIFTSPFTEWLSQWPSAGVINLTTKPASGISGYIYTLNPNTKSLTSVFGKINGLTTLTSPNGKLILYGNDNLSLNIYHTDTKVSDLVGVRTMPEKCVWSGTGDSLYCAVPKSIDTGAYPDSWYQGEVSFNDQIWKVDIKTGNTTMLIDPTTVGNGEEIDGTKLALDAGENYLFFVNKKDSYLWELALK